MSGMLDFLKLVALFSIVGNEDTGSAKIVPLKLSISVHHFIFHEMPFDFALFQLSDSKINFPTQFHSCHLNFLKNSVL